MFPLQSLAGFDIFLRRAPRRAGSWCFLLSIFHAIRAGHRQAGQDPLHSLIGRNEDSAKLCGF
jgi:hypothetical protein